VDPLVKIGVSYSLSVLKAIHAILNDGNWERTAGISNIPPYLCISFCGMISSICSQYLSFDNKNLHYY